MSAVRKSFYLLHCLWGKECLVKDSYFIWLLLSHPADVFEFALDLYLVLKQ